MKTNRERICLIILVLLNFTSFIVSAQSGFKLVDLQGKIWIQKGTGTQLVEEKFEADKLIISLNKKHTVKFEFYLSNAIDSVFDSAKVGKISDGKYIIRRPSRGKGEKYPPLRISVFEIIKLNQDSLILKNSKQQLIEYLSQEY